MAMSPLPLGAALRRGAWLTIANWPVVIIDFAIESLYTLAVAVPVIGGAFMVAVLLGADMREIVAEGVRATADLVMGSLTAAPLALAAFLVALAVVGLGGAMLMHVIKAGTLLVLVRGDRAGGEFHRAPISQMALRPAAAFSLATVVDGARRFGRRTVTLTLWLGVAYLFVAAGLALVIALQSRLAASRWAPAWPLLLLIATSASAVAIMLINVVFDLVRLVVVTDDCRTREAARRLKTFVIADARQVLGIFGVMTALLTVTTAASLTAVASVTLVAWVPIAGLIVVPLQIIAWLVRGVLLQCLALTALAAYQTQYRRFAEPPGAVDRPPAAWVHPA
jgi:hypothetical protein